MLGDSILMLLELLEEQWKIPLLLFSVLLLIGLSSFMRPYRSIRYVWRAMIWEACSCTGIILYWPLRTQIACLIPPLNKIFSCLPLAGGISGTAAFLYLGLHYIFNSRKLKESKDLEVENPIAAWKKLREIPESSLMPGQKRKYKNRALYQLTMLGAVGKAQMIAESMKSANTPLYHMVRGLHELEAGSMAAAASQMLTAQEICTSDTEKYLQAQILTNNGVIKVCQGHYDEADYFFNQARLLFKTYKKCSIKMLETIYYNYCFNRCRLAGSGLGITWQEALEEYRGMVGQTRAETFLSACNIEWELMRQAGTQPEIMEQKVQAAFSRALAMDLTVQQRCIFEGSMARMVCNMRMNPEPCLEALERDWRHVQELPMPSRYETMKSVDLLFRDLGSDRLLEKYHGMDTASEHYITGTGAEKDLKEYLASLPVEAIRERCYCEMELAGLKKQNSKTYCFAEAKELLDGVIATYLENHLGLLAVDARLAIVDESIFLLNLTDHHKPMYPDEMQKQLRLIETALETMEKHPKLAECALRLSYYYYHLDDYPKCIYWFERFEQMGIALEHFAPWLCRYHEACALVVPMLRFYQVILKVRENQAKLQTYEDAVQDWFRDFFQSDGCHAALLLGKFRGYDDVPVKMKVWYEEDNPHLRFHFWFSEPCGHLDVDLTYEQFHADRDAKCILFSDGHHPFEVEESYYLQKCSRNSPLIFKGIERKLISWSALPPETKALLEKIYEIIVTEYSVQF